jgi:molybdopterin-guanine dinucleotide biosynthesis protein B
MNEYQNGSLKVTNKRVSPPVVCIVGNSGSGKTTFIERLIPELKRRGLKVGTLKHDVHGFEMDKPGKDSWRHKQAGASTTIISSSQKIGIVMDVDHDYKPDELLTLFSDMDIVLAEGYKRTNRPKLEIFRAEIAKEPLSKEDKSLLAIVSDTTVDLDAPRFSTKDIKGVTDFLLDYFNLSPAMNTDQRNISSIG